MSAIAFDTLAYAKKLKAVGVPSEQAEIQAETIAEVMDERMATKRDLDLSENNLRHDMKEIESNLRHDMAKIKHDMKEIESNLRHNMKEMEGRLNLEIEKLRGEVSKEIAHCKADLVRWQIGLAFGIVGVLFALMKLTFVR
jgi:hypothetical protein